MNEPEAIGERMAAHARRKPVPEIIEARGADLYRLARHRQGPNTGPNGCCLTAAKMAAAALAAAALAAHGHFAVIVGPTQVAVDSPKLVRLNQRFRIYTRPDQISGRELAAHRTAQREAGACGLLVRDHFAIYADGWLVDVATPDWSRPEHGMAFTPLVVPWGRGHLYATGGCRLVYLYLSPDPPYLPDFPPVV